MSVQEAVFLQLSLVALSVAAMGTLLPLTPIFRMKHQKSSALQCNADGFKRKVQTWLAFLVISMPAVCQQGGALSNALKGFTSALKCLSNALNSSLQALRSGFKYP